MIIMFLISLVLLLLVIPNLRVKKRIREDILSNWDYYEWRYLGRYKLKVWEYILIFLIFIVPILNIIVFIISFIALCIPPTYRENKRDEGCNLEETIVYLKWSDKITSFLNKEI